MTTSNEAYFRRALSAYFKAGGNAQPDHHTSGVCSHKDRSYVYLRNVNGVLAVYRIQTQGRLRRLKRWPDVPEYSVMVRRALDVYGNKAEAA